MVKVWFLSDWRNSIYLLNLKAEDVLLKNDVELASIFNIHSRQKDYVEPDYDKIREYVETPRAWANKLNSIANAWRYKYVKVYFPDYVSGKLPVNCMSLKTFNRRYNQYLEDSGLDFMRRQPNCNNATLTPNSLLSEPAFFTLTIKHSYNLRWSSLEITLNRN